MWSKRRYAFLVKQVLHRGLNSGFWLAILSACGFSLKAIYVKQAYNIAEVDAIVLLSLRMLFSFPIFVLVGLSAFKGSWSLSKRQLALLIFVGLSGYYCASILDFMGLAYISAGLERIILFSYPVLTILIGVLFLGHKFERQLLIPIVMCMLGISLASFADITTSQTDHAVYLGVLLVFGSALAYAIYQVFSVSLIEQVGSARFSILAMLVAIVGVQIHFFIQLPVQALSQPVEIYWICFQMAIFSTVLPVFLQSRAIKLIGVSRLVLISTLGPILTIFFGWLILNESVTYFQILGATLVLAGVSLIKKVQRH